ncbi:PA domain-containing protein [Stenotrophomonas humi]
MKKSILAAFVAASLCACVSVANAQAKITLVNQDPLGEGLNSPKPAKPEGGNVGVTVGQQRLIAYQYAMDIWGALLSSDTEIRVGAAFFTGECKSDGPIALGMAAPTSRVSSQEFSPWGEAGYSYPVAFANALAKRDFTPQKTHIITSFNAVIDDPSCTIIPGGWYYGLNGNVGNSRGGSNFLNVIMHEIGHGLGLMGISQKFFGAVPWRPYKTPWDGLAWSNTYGISYNDFSEYDERLEVALVASGETVWTGRRTNATAALLADHRELLVLRAPVAAKHEFEKMRFGGSDFAAFGSNQIVLLNDAAAPDADGSHSGCGGESNQAAVANGKELSGKIALIDGGGCELGLKALNAQKSGAVAVIIANDESGLFQTLRGGALATQVRIPVVGVSRSVGMTLRGGAAVVTEGILPEADRFYGLHDNKRMRLYMPSVYAGGSTFSHVDTDMSPNALMEPAETKTLRADITVDVALDMFEDLGWPTNRNGTAKIAGCDTTVPVYRDTFIPGANLIAHNNMCRDSAGGSRGKQLRCMNDQISSLHRQQLITSAEMMKARQCVAKL